MNLFEDLILNFQIFPGNTEQLAEELVPFELAENQKMFLKLQGAMKEIGQAHASLEGTPLF